MKILKQISWGLCVFVAVVASQANASHFRGAAMVPSVSSTGLLTIETDSFWRFTAPNTPAPRVTGTGLANIFAAQQSSVTDLSDTRRAKVTSTHTIQLPSAGTYSIDWDSCCHQAGISNSSGNWGMDATIVWDGSTATQPIFFDLENIQQQVLIGSAYSDNLDATPAAGLSLSYSLLVNTGMSGQAPGLTLDAAGNLDLSAATTAASPYSNPAFPNGTSFAGIINSSDGSSVEFEWVFLSCDNSPGSNIPCAAIAPQIQDVVVNALVGDTINQTMLAVEDTGQLFQAPNLLTSGWDALQSFNCSGGPAGNMPSWNPGTQAFSWDSTGTAVGACTASFRVTDAEGLTDTGSLVINLSTNNQPPCGTAGGPACPVPEPGTLPLLGLGILGLVSFLRRRNNLKIES